MLCLLAFGLIQHAHAQELKWFRNNTHTHSL
jgi:hypothetical protein